jgi:hypothetical protein
MKMAHVGSVLKADQLALNGLAEQAGLKKKLV